MDTADEGPELDVRWADANSNVCGVLYGCRDASTVAAHVVRAGWRSRSSSWAGYELETTWCRLEITPVDAPDVLLTGVVDPARLDELGRILRALGFPYTLELSDETDTMVREIQG